MTTDGTPRTRLWHPALPCFPARPSPQDVYKKLGITSDAVAAKAAELVAYFGGKQAPPVPAVSPFFVAPSSAVLH